MAVTRQLLMKKWLMYGFGLFPIWFLDCFVLGRYPIEGATPMLLPLTVAAVATLEGRLAGGAFGMWVGFVWETTYPGGWGGLIFVLTLFGFLAGAGVEKVLQKGFLGFFISGFGILVGVETLTILAWMLTGHGNHLELVALAGRQVALSILYTPLVYVIFRKIFSKVGGTRLA